MSWTVSSRSRGVSALRAPCKEQPRDEDGSHESTTRTLIRGRIECTQESFLQQGNGADGIASPSGLTIVGSRLNERKKKGLHAMGLPLDEYWGDELVYSSYLVDLSLSIVS